MGVLLVLGSQAAPPRAASNPNDDIKDKPLPEVRPPSQRLVPDDINATTGRSKRVSPKSPRTISLFPRDASRVQIVQLPTTPEGVVTYRCRGGIRLVCRSQKFGTIRMEADEAVIKRVERRKDDMGNVASNGEIWIDEVDLPMEVQLKGNTVVRRDEGKTVDRGGELRASQINYDFVTDCAVTPKAEPELAASEPKMPSRPRVTSIFARGAKRLEITQLAQTIEGVQTLNCRGGIRIVSTSSRFGIVSMEATEAVIVRNTYRKKVEPVSGPHPGQPDLGSRLPDGAVWVEEDELPMQVQLKGVVILHQEQAKNAGKSEQRTFRAQ